jgi:hypothetical protein
MTPLQQALDALSFYATNIIRRNSTGELATMTILEHDCGDKARAALGVLAAPLADPAGLQGQDLADYWKLRALSAEETAIAGILDGVRAYQRNHVKTVDPAFNDFMPEDNQEAVKWLLAKMASVNKPA